MADTYDVMTARDTYRDPVTSMEAMRELQPLMGDVGADLGKAVQRAGKSPRESSQWSQVGHIWTLPLWSLRKPQPVYGCVGVVLSGARRSKPSGVLSLPGPVPGESVRPYCQTMRLVFGLMITTRSR